jgi:hypothetical protein
MTVDAADRLDSLRRAALAQPGAVERQSGIKFQCPACRADGHDAHHDNAILFRSGGWGCAWAKETALARAHYEAIGDALGALEPGISMRSDPDTIEPDLEAIELHDLLARTFPDDPGIVGHGVLPTSGIAVLGAPGKIGKSFLVLNLVLVRGRSWLGFPTRGGRTLVVQAEIPEPHLQRRIGILRADAALPPKDTTYFITDRRLKLDRSEGVTRLRRLLDRIRPDLLILDPLARFFSGDENSTRDMGAFIDQLESLLATYAPLCILLVHHTGWRGKHLRGASALFDAADSILMLQREGKPESEQVEGKPSAFRLTFELRHAEALEPMRLSRNAHGWYSVGPSTRRRGTEPSPALVGVVSIVSKASTPLPWKALCHALERAEGITKKAAETRVKKAVDRGHIIHGDGGYTLPPRVPDSPMLSREGGQHSLPAFPEGEKVPGLPTEEELRFLRGEEPCL